MKTDKERYIAECKSRWDEGFEFNKNPDNVRLLMEIVDLRTEIEGKKCLLDSKRAILISIMKQYKCSKVVNLTKGVIASISESRKRHTKKVFNEELFKLEHPDLYKQYLYSESSISSGSRLTISKLTSKAMKTYASICDIPTLSELKEKCEYLVANCLMTKEDFIGHVDCGGITDYDGFGYYVSNEGVEVKPVDFDVEVLKNSEFNFVSWYNK